MPFATLLFLLDADDFVFNRSRMNLDANRARRNESEIDIF